MASAAYRKRSREAGCCYDCPRPALPGRTRCEYHRGKHSKNSTRFKEKLVKQGRCYCCGRPMLEEGMNCALCCSHETGGFKWK